MDSNPFAKIRFRQARNNLATLKTVLKDGDWNRFIELMEEEALTLHALMMTGKSGYLLMQPGTISIIHKVREFRRETRCRIGFTLDAGANVHLLHGDDEADQVEDFLVTELLPYCENGRVIRDRMGKGPEKLSS